MADFIYYRDVPEHLRAWAPHPECTLNGECWRHPDKKRLETEPGKCTAAVAWDDRYGPCYAPQRKGDDLCGVHAAMRDKRWLAALKRSAQERVDASRAERDTPERFYFWERWKERRR
jgi:hypothetical protein